MKRETRVERITRYETMLNEVTEVLRKAEQAIDEYEAVRPKVEALEKYYTSPTWKRDFKASEEGKLPADLPAGVLSEDGINDVLDDDLTLREKMKALSKSQAKAAISPQRIRTEHEYDHGREDLLQP